jgi:hypothetical protein
VEAPFQKIKRETSIKGEKIKLLLKLSVPVLALAAALLIPAVPAGAG